MPTVCVVSASLEGQSDKIADRIATRLADREIEAVRLRLPADAAADLAGFDGAVLGGSVHVGKHARTLADFVQRNRDVLASRPTAFFSVSLSAAGASDEQQADAQRLRSSFLDQASWQPDISADFAGALRYRSYGLLKRWLMKRIAAKAGGDTDTSRDHEYTDWDQVDALGDQFADLLGSRAQRSQASDPSGSV